MIRTPVILLLALLSGLHLEGKTITTAAELQKFQLSCKEMPLTPFVITGRVNAASGWPKPIIIEDQTGLAYIYGQPDRGVPYSGEHTLVALSGKVFVSRKEHRFVPWAYIRSCITLGPAAPPPIVSVPIRDLKPDTNAFPEEVRQLIAESSRQSDLTYRQLEILSAATRGLTTNDIARQLDISVSCVLKHFTVIFEKLGVANRAEAVAIAISKQLVKL